MTNIEMKKKFNKGVQFKSKLALMLNELLQIMTQCEGGEYVLQAQWKGQ